MMMTPLSGQRFAALVRRQRLACCAVAVILLAGGTSVAQPRPGKEGCVLATVRVDPAAFANRPWRQRLLELLALAATRTALFLTGRRY